jgi:hypothetical protein
VQHRRWSFGDGGARAKVVQKTRETERESQKQKIVNGGTFLKLGFSFSFNLNF